MVDLDAEQVRSLYKEGKSLAKIAEIVGCSSESIRRFMVKNGIERKPVGAQREFSPNPDELREMYQTKTLLQIANHYGVGETVVWNRVKEFGIAVEGREMGHRGLHKRERRHKEAQSIAFRGKWSGEKNPHWKGGVHMKNLQERGTGAYKQWKLKALELHGNACQHCGVIKGSTCECCGYKIQLHVHHVFPFATHPEQRYDPTNSEVLCPKCHALSHGRKIG
jgi:5-methylcytosine-specific restriction endonuclease McrA